MKKLLSIILCLSLFTSVFAFTVSAEGSNPFTDVKEKDYYYEPVLWAVANGITTGTSATEFSPVDECTRAQVVTFLWRAAGKPEPGLKENPFGDVGASAYYCKAVLWAVEEGITTGTSATEFSPEDICTRGQIVTFIYRYMTSKEDHSLTIFRQAMVETPQLFAVAYFGYVLQDADPFAVMQEAAPQLCEDLPFLLMIDQNHILGDEGQLFCIVPADENATVAVNRRPWNPETESYEEPEVLYRSESGSPILVMCPNEDWIPDTEVVITDSNGTVTVWSPCLDPSYHVSGLRNENGESMIFDFTSYDELSGLG